MRRVNYERGGILIKYRNQGEYAVELGFSGSHLVTSGGGAFVLPFGARLKAIYARLGTAGVTGALTVDVFKNGATLLGSGTALSFASTATVPTYNTAFTTNPPTFIKGDVVTLSLGAVQSTPAKDLVVELVFERQRSQSWDDIVQTETWGADNDAIG
jgi:hypothetical protein